MLPVLFKIGSFPVRSFGIMILIAFLSAIWLIRRRAAKFGFDGHKVTDLAFYLLIAGILGARVLFLIQELPYYSKHLDQVFSLKFEGLTSFGGIIFAVPVMVWWARKHQASYAKLFDLFAPAFMLGHVFGRVGCLLNGCCYGGVCDAKFPLGVHFADAPGLHHPAQAYDSVMNLIGLGILLAYEKRGFRPGQGVGAFLVLHGLTRFIYEFWRAGTDDQVRTGLASSTYWGSLPITQAQGVALAMMLIGGVVWFFAGRREPRQVEPVAAEMQAA